MRYASICSGIEAVSVAFQPLGWQPVFFSEIESFPCAVLQHYHPNVPNYGDMTKFKDWKYEPIDLLVGGTPCQSFSIAGLRKGLDDPRGNLALVFLAIVDKYRPKWVVWENVPGVHSSWSDASHVIASSASEKAGREARRLAREAGFDGYAAESFGEFEEVVQSNDFDCFLAGLEQLGYGVATTILDCQFFGLAQRRERVFVVGHLGDWRRPAAVLFDASCVSWNFAPSRHAPSRQAGKRISPTIGGGPPFSRTGNDRVESEALVADTLRANGGQGSRKDKQPMVYAFQSRIARNGRGDMGDKVNALNAQSGETGKGDAAPLVAIGVDLFNQAETGDVHCPLRTAGGHGDGAHMGGGSTAKTLTVDELSRTLNAGGMGRKDWETETFVPTSQGGFFNMAVRRLTPTECARLQGFPDHYLDIEYNGKPACDGPKYRALGNSFPVPVIRWIGQRIQMMEDLEL